MRRQATVCSLLLCLLLAQGLSAQTGDWSTVISIPLGTLVKVRIERGTVRCTLVSVTEAELMCEREARRFERTAKYVINRHEIKQAASADVRPRWQEPA